MKTTLLLKQDISISGGRSPLTPSHEFFGHHRRNGFRREACVAGCHGPGRIRRSDRRTPAAGRPRAAPGDQTANPPDPWKTEPQGSEGSLGESPQPLGMPTWVYRQTMEPTLGVLHGQLNCYPIVIPCYPKLLVPPTPSSGPG